MQNNLTELLNLIHQNVAIDEVISEHIHLEKKGNNYVGLCPFHQDSKPSLSVSPTKGIFKCFSCGAGGDAVAFVKNYKGINFIDAVKEIATNNKIDWRDYLTEYKTKQVDPEVEKIIALNEAVLIFFKYNLDTLKDDDSLLNKYLLSRNLLKQQIDTFELGYATSNNSLTKFLLKKGYSEEDILQAGVCKNYDGDIKDYFINRLIFPIRDFNNKLVGFSGRIIEKSKYTKYLNSPETKAFKKSEIIYNLSQATSPISLKGFAIIVEGFMDVIAFDRNGIKNCLATMGTSLSKTHLFQLKKHTQNIILAFDNDTPGINATIKAGKELIKHQFDVKVFSIKDAKDIDEYSKNKSMSELNEELENVLKFIEFYKIQIEKAIDKKSMNFELIRSFLRVLSSVNDELQTDFYLNEIAQEFNIDKSILLKEYQMISKILIEHVNENIDSNYNYPQPIDYSSNQLNPHWKDNEIKKYSSFDLENKRNIVIKDERLIIYFLSKNKVFFENIELDNYHFIDDISSIMFKILQQLYKSNKKFGNNEILNFFPLTDQDEVKSILNMRDVIDDEKRLIIEINQLLNRLKFNQLKEQSNKLHQKIKETSDSEHKIFLIKRLKEIKF
ncbi:MAG: DNA primase [Mycoplasmataceae bacterium]|nr:DNA primase [Mycoplasmataceae bacterium]